MQFRGPKLVFVISLHETANITPSKLKQETHSTSRGVNSFSTCSMYSLTVNSFIHPDQTASTFAEVQ
jgi:hypothetical protein